VAGHTEGRGGDLVELDVRELLVDSLAARFLGRLLDEPAHVLGARQQLRLDEAGVVREARRPALGVLLDAERGVHRRRDEVRRRVLEHLEVDHAATTVRASERVLHLLRLGAWMRHVFRLINTSEVKHTDSVGFGMRGRPEVDDVGDQVEERGVCFASRSFREPPHPRPHGGEREAELELGEDELLHLEDLLARVGVVADVDVVANLRCATSIFIHRP